MSGPPRTPTAELVARGSRLAPGRLKQAQPSSIAPTCPPDLSEQVESVWYQVIEQLREIGTLATVDTIAIERLCCMVVDWRKAQRFIDKNGFAYTLYRIDKDGELVLDGDGEKILQQRIQHPEVGVRNKAHADLLRIEQQFGLTWASRAALEIPADSDVPEIETRDRSPQSE